MPRPNLSILLGLWVSTVGGVAAAQEQQETAALSGPSVSVGHAPTLVTYAYGGELKELELPPAEAALEFIELDEHEAERVADALARRADLIERIVIDNFDFLIQAETIGAAENKLAQAGFFLKAIHMFYPLIERGPIEDEIRPLLDAESLRTYDGILNEYWEALARTRIEAAEDRVTRQRIKREVRKARRDQYGKEIELAAQRAIESEGFAVGYLLRDMDLSEAQDARIQRMITDFVARNMGEASQEETEKLFAGIIAFLNEKQRKLLADRIKGL